MSSGSFGLQKVASGLAISEREDTFEHTTGIPQHAAYREKFDFPFIIAVRRHDKHAILAAFEARLRNGLDDEIQAALAQIAEIARLRLDALAKER
jgi:2-oxo-4-hydroxy-4-carboxy--5-ureidoimidazoline (OHCU) decarboxylase